MLLISCSIDWFCTVETIITPSKNIGAYRQVLILTVEDYEQGGALPKGPF